MLRVASVRVTARHLSGEVVEDCLSLQADTAGAKRKDLTLRADDARLANGWRRLLLFLKLDLRCKVCMVQLRTEQDALGQWGRVASQPARLKSPSVRSITHLLGANIRCDRHRAKR